MAGARLSASVEVASLLRRAAADGDFAAVLHKGDPERGALLILVRSRDRYVCALERALAMTGGYQWAQTGPDESSSDADLADFLKKRLDFDQDLWVIELDIAQPERFIAETTLSG